MDIVDGLLGWAMAMLVIAAATAVGGIGLIVQYSARPLERRYRTGGGGLAGGFSSGLEAVFSPTAHEAGLERDRMTRRTAPARAAEEPPWTIDGERIRIEV